jgi:hypothetical protein
MRSGSRALFMERFSKTMSPQWKVQDNLRICDFNVESYSRIRSHLYVDECFFSCRS